MINANLFSRKMRAPAQLPSFEGTVFIRSGLASKYSTRVNAQISPTILNGIVDALTGNTRYEETRHGFRFEFRTKSGSQRLGGDPSAGTRTAAYDSAAQTLANVNSGVGYAVATLFHSLTSFAESEVRTAWFALLDEVGATSYIGGAQLAWIDSTPSARDRLIHLCDAVYFEAERLFEGITETEAPLSAITQDRAQERLWSKTIEARASEIPDPHLERLERLCRFGGAALLTGPTGTFKTETAKRSALACAAQLVVLKGRPGLEDRDFFGAVVPTTNGARYVDGPLTRAFRLACQEHTVLVIDELMRFESHHLAALIGALDTVSPDELLAMSIAPVEEARHRVIELPTGERIAAPVSRLTVLATTNLGDDYQQAGVSIDAALLGRFNLTLEFNYAPERTALAIYSALTGSSSLAHKMLEIEKWTRTNTNESGGLLLREANPRVIISLIEELGRLRTAQNATSEPDANDVVDAAEVTVVPFCVPRLANGRLDEEAARLLRDAIKDLWQPKGAR